MLKVMWRRRGRVSWIIFWESEIALTEQATYNDYLDNRSKLACVSILNLRGIY